MKATILKNGLQNKVFVFCLIVVMSSCSGHKFLNRKYTSGRFIENKKSLTHNTIYVDTTKYYSSSNNQLELKKTSTISTNISEKEIINKKVESIIKKDSIFIKQKKGKDSVYTSGKLDKDVIVILKRNNKIEYKKGKEANKFNIKRIYTESICALVFFFIPGISLASILSNKHSISVYKKLHPNSDIKKIELINNVALLLSIIIHVALFSAFLYQLIFVPLVFSISI